ncbi:MAG TPA: GNAT family N-acetyltransferase [Chloroflexia bacterium]|nr:GNAT family N-acetyltransferase [Chloroflexia bacterium]
MLDVIDNRIDAEELTHHVSRFTFHVSRFIHHFAAMRAEWLELMESSDAGVFNSWEWLYPWYTRIGTGRELHILTARDGEGILLGVMPLCMERRRVMGQTLRRLAFLGETEVGSDYLDVVARRGYEEDVTRIFLQSLRASADEWDVLDLLDMDAGSRTVRDLQEVFGSGAFVVEINEGSICPYETFVPGETSDGFLRRTRRYDNYVRRRKWLQKQPGYRIEVTNNPGEVAAPLSEFMRLHALRWAEDGGSQGITGPEVEAFHRDATQLLAERGQLRLYTMMVGDKAVASVYGIVHGGTFIYYQSGRDPEWQSKSVGLVLVGETFKDAIDMGLREYDFLRGVETYKSDWVTRERRTVGVRVYKQGSKGAWLTRSERASRTTRRLFKEALPGKVVELLKRSRK